VPPSGCEVPGAPPQPSTQRHKATQLQLRAIRNLSPPALTVRESQQSNKDTTYSSQREGRHVFAGKVRLDRTCADGQEAATRAQVLRYAGVG